MQWKTIKEFENYAVSDQGQIVRLPKRKLIAFSKQHRKYTSYNRVTLFNGTGKRYYKRVHRLVAEAFIPNPYNLPQVNHIDGDGLNNKISNLEWCTASNNIKAAFKLNPERKKEICQKGGLLGGGVAQKKAEARLKTLLGERFIAFYKRGVLHDSAAVKYKCTCGIVRKAVVGWKEIRVHKGKCPICTNTVNRSSKSL